MLTGFHIKIAVFSTYVEVILYDEGIGAVICGILHVCGGDPLFNGHWSHIIWYSPRMWR